MSERGERVIKSCAVVPHDGAERSGMSERQRLSVKRRLGRGGWGTIGHCPADAARSEAA